MTNKTIADIPRGIKRQKTLLKRGLHPQGISRLIDKKLLVSVGRGVYMTPQTAITENHDLAIANARIPHGTVCLLSALNFHGMTTQIPREVWIAIENRAASPRFSTPPLRIIRLTDPSLNSGIEKHIIEGVDVRIYCPAKTVADCFKFRNKIGLDVAMEALKDYLRLKKGTVDELWHFAKINRVARVIQPYLEASV
ncbi:MAG: transcriptional regulator [candidate division Zixibacteria bacterium]|nr:transcriptional regulator [candidate division Zixibacteria bacterium]